MGVMRIAKVGLWNSSLLNFKILEWKQNIIEFGLSNIIFLSSCQPFNPSEYIYITENIWETIVYKMQNRL